MAALYSSPNGFSYAQAAKGRSSVASSQAPSSKVTSGAATPATGSLSETPSGSNWADDVEANVTVKGREAPRVVQTQAQNKGAPVKETVVERAKNEEKQQNEASGVSSPDLTASTSAKDDDLSSAPNGSASETTWESKSQSSEPAWVVERKDRQTTSQLGESAVEGEQEAKETSPEPSLKPTTLHDAPPPTVNPWLRRQEETQAKLAKRQPAPNPGMYTPDPLMQENQRPHGDTKKKVASVSSRPQNNEQQIAAVAEAKKPGATAAAYGKRANEIQTGNPSPNSFVAVGDTTAGSLKAVTHPRPSLSTAPPPSVKDEVSWPTPDTTIEKDRKDLPERDSTGQLNEEIASTSKPRNKPEWQKMVVTPNIIFETQNIRGRDGPRGSERGGRGGLRGRGALRGGANGTNNRRSEDEGPQRGRGAAADRETMAMAPSAKPVRASSTGSWHERNKESPADRNLRVRIFAEPRVGDKKNVISNPDAITSADNGSKPDSESRSPISSTHAGATASGAAGDDRTPEPIPRRSSVGTPIGVNGEATGANPPVRMIPSESRRESRTFDNFKESHYNGPSRGIRRGRGRGGSREYSNGHSANQGYGNSHSAEFNGPPPYGVPPSPSTYQGSRGNHQFSYQQQGRGGNWRGNPRSQSIPMEGAYGRFVNPYSGPQSNLPPVQTYVPAGMYDYNGYPMTAVPYHPYMDHQYLVEMVSTQLEYYFSIDNLLKDMFLRKNMDSQGFVFLDVIASFNRIKHLTEDKDLLRFVCLRSETIEICVGEDHKERLRKREGWEQFLLPMEQREPSAQTEGVQHLQSPERPPMLNYGSMPFLAPVSAGPQSLQHRLDRRSYDSGHSPMTGLPNQFGNFPVADGVDGERVNSEDERGRSTKSPIHDSGSVASPAVGAPSNGKDAEPDAFPDEQAEVLTVVVKMNQQRMPVHGAASRTFSNGSIDSRGILNEMGKKSADGQITNGDGLVNGRGPGSSASRGASPNSLSTERPPTDPAISLFWMKDQNVPSEGLPTDVALEPYVRLRLKALDQREHAATGTCPYDMDVLYQFWCHFLIRNFNGRMYDDFKRLANEDAADRHSLTGLQNLIKFYAQALLSHNPIRDRLVKDYAELVESEPPKLEGAAFKQLRSAWRNGALNLKNRKKLADVIDDGLKERLR